MLTNSNVTISLTIMLKRTATSKAASLLGKRSWKARLQKYGLKGMKEIFSEGGKKATGRPRMPGSKVKPATLYQRERRARLKARTRVKKGKKG
jgi:hypothetical protein